MELELVKANAALINAANGGTLEWIRRTDSKTRPVRAGEPDRVAIVSCRISGAYLWHRLAEEPEGTPEYRRVRLEDIRELAPTV
jgi:hypothetical protein